MPLNFIKCLNNIVCWICYNWLVIRALAGVTTGVKGYSIYPVINYSLKTLSSHWLQYQKSFRLGGRQFRVSFRFRKISWCCTEESLSTKGDMISILSGYFYSIWQKCQSVGFLPQGSVDSAVPFFFLFSWGFVVVTVFSMKRMYLLIRHCIPQSPGLWNCQSVRTEFFFKLN